MPGASPRVYTFMPYKDPSQGKPGLSYAPAMTTAENIIKALRAESERLGEAAGGFQAEIERLGEEADAGNPDVPALWRATIQREVHRTLADSLRKVADSAGS